MRYIKILKTLHPAQNPIKASRHANKVKTEIRIIEKLTNPKTNVTTVLNEKIRPTPCANLFGGPGTNFSWKFNLGTRILVTTRANGLIFGPDVTLAKNPYTKSVKGINT